jgi:hypothetical protein
MTDTKRQYMIGATVVFADKFGPYKFMRHGEEVTCICDPAHNLVCEHHASRNGPLGRLGTDPHNDRPCRAEVAGVPLIGYPDLNSDPATSFDAVFHYSPQGRWEGSPCESFDGTLRDDPEVPVDGPQIHQEAP